MNIIFRRFACFFIFSTNGHITLVINITNEFQNVYYLSHCNMNKCIFFIKKINVNKKDEEYEIQN